MNEIIRVNVSISKEYIRPLLFSFNIKEPKEVPIDIWKKVFSYAIGYVDKENQRILEEVALILLRNQNGYQEKQYEDERFEVPISFPLEWIQPMLDGLGISRMNDVAVETWEAVFTHILEMVDFDDVQIQTEVASIMNGFEGWELPYL